MFYPYFSLFSLSWPTFLLFFLDFVSFLELADAVATISLVLTILTSFQNVNKVSPLWRGIAAVVSLLAPECAAQEIGCVVSEGMVDGHFVHLVIGLP